MTARDTRIASRWLGVGLSLLVLVLTATDRLSAQSHDLRSASADTNALPAGRMVTNTWPPGYVELKRQWTNRGTPQESSKTTLRLQVDPEHYLSQVRVDIPFVDEK